MGLKLAYIFYYLIMTEVKPQMVFGIMCFDCGKKNEASCEDEFTQLTIKSVECKTSCYVKISC